MAVIIDTHKNILFLFMEIQLILNKIQATQPQKKTDNTLTHKKKS